MIRRTDFVPFLDGLANIVVEVEYGLNEPPADMVTAAKLRLRQRLNLNKSGIPDRAATWTAAEGGTYQLDRASAYKTGSDVVDSVYERYSLRQRGDGEGKDGGGFAPASRPWDLDPQRYSMFHGPRR